MQKLNMLIFTLLAFLQFPGSALAQNNDARISLAILPFVAADGAVIVNRGNVNTVQEAVTKEFSDRSRFQVLDRSKFDVIVQELNIQKSEEFLNSRIVEQGKALGAQYLVAGVINELRVMQAEKKVGKDIEKVKKIRDMITNRVDKKGNMTDVNINSYQGSLRMAFAVINVETHELIYNQTLNVKSEDFMYGDSITSITKVIEKMQAEVKTEIRNLFSPTLKVLAVDKADKNGLPQTVLINGGGSMFTSTSDKNIRLGVYVTEAIGEFKREKQLGELRVQKIEGEVVVCQVKDGGKEIQEKLSGGANLMVKVIPAK